MGIDRPAPGTGLKVHFKDSNGNLIKTVEANEGDDILAIAHEYDIDLEGACEGSVACSTCHVILPEEYYDLLPEPEDDENDMLDMAFGLTDTSRLGCQVKLTKELDGITCTLPSATRNIGPVVLWFGCQASVIKGWIGVGVLRKARPEKVATGKKPSH
ncbi:Adrenodoxin-like protein, mitochondrial [Psilocybe cubensis]|uniref:Adrenodoxin-like protein, mitochondrial n=1 Tax=Psilocybe cubensis TaxID=181762 RepID=A0ACB8GH20_PSICU|nr:Adrenodoxin-like protein, mitochondrial [Psilocybe cubensis]KAH9474908.1 Adrenodoxin-like protein, mitochondrial [Psilocybe cubensis]